MTFSQRHGIRRPEAGLTYEAAPDKVINGLFNTLRDLEGDIPDDFFGRCVRVAGAYLDLDIEDLEWEDVEIGRNDLSHMIRKQLQAKDGGWHEFYDFVEVIFVCLPIGLRDQFSNRINDVFRRNYIGYELRDAKIERLGGTPGDATIAEARGLLRDERFDGPNEQFLKALSFLSQRPQPDLANAVKDAVGALEGLVRILLDKPKILLSDATKQLVRWGRLPAPLAKVIDGIYAYRGNEEGVAHGQTARADVAPEVAEFVVTTAAACIVLVASAYEIRIARHERD
jgi:hypothetical protein